MPLHRYKCNKCGEEFTRLVRTQDKDEIKCDKCGSMEVEKLLPRISVGRGKTGEGSSSRISSCSTCLAKNCANCGK